jgi:hypothetical protein
VHNIGDGYGGEEEEAAAAVAVDLGIESVKKQQQQQ